MNDLVKSVLTLLYRVTVNKDYRERVPPRAYIVQEFLHVQKTVESVRAWNIILKSERERKHIVFFDFSYDSWNIFLHQSINFHIEGSKS